MEGCDIWNILTNRVYNVIIQLKTYLAVHSKTKGYVMKKFYLLLCILVPITSWAQSALFYIGAPYEYVSQGRTRLITSEEGALFEYIPSYGNGLHLFITKGQERWELDFELGNQGALTIGEHLNVREWPFNHEDPGMFLAMGGRANNQITGKFDVLDVKYEDGELRSAAIDFLQFSNGNPDRWIVGSVRFNSSIPVMIPEPLPITLLVLAGFCIVYRYHFRRHTTS